MTSNGSWSPGRPEAEALRLALEFDPPTAWRPPAVPFHLLNLIDPVRLTHLLRITAAERQEPRVDHPDRFLTAFSRTRDQETDLDTLTGRAINPDLRI
jgi:hypothetical protein